MDRKMFLSDKNSCTFPLNEGKFNLGSRIVSVTLVSIFVGIEICNSKFNSAFFFFLFIVSYKLSVFS